MSKVDELRKANSSLFDDELDKTTVVEEDAKEIESFYGISGIPEEPTPQITPELKTAIPYEKIDVVVKRAAGRPKTRIDNELYSQIHINLPESLKIKARQAITCRRTNMNSYIVSLIEKDISENGEEYDSLYRSLAKFS